VLDAENPDLLRLVIGQMKTQASNHRISALLVHPPESGHLITDALKKNGFLPNRLHRLIEATLLVDTSRSSNEILNGLRRTTRQAIRQSIRRGVTIREGSESDLPLFFRLMQNTCIRQGNVVPNPSTLESLASIWKSLNPSGHLRLTFAEINGTAVSGLLCIGFGDRLTLWKKGWNDNHCDKHPNELLTYEALEWAREKGYKFCDFCAMDRQIAEEILQGKQLSMEQMASRHFFNIGFGGVPAILPAAHVWLGNYVVRKCYGLFLKNGL
jgi:lipid II:glycine glycyltransferase (peptidoglycan interpeptide bridge formation enzyme)